MQDSWETEQYHLHHPRSPPLLETLIQVSPDGQALTSVVLHRNLSYWVKTMTQQKGLDQHLWLNQIKVSEKWTNHTHYPNQWESLDANWIREIITKKVHLNPLYLNH